MASAASSDKWTILIDSQREDDARVYKLEGSTRVEEVKALWCESVGASPDSIVFLTTAGAVVHNARTLLDVGELTPGQKKIIFNAEEDCVTQASTPSLGGDARDVERRPQTAAAGVQTGAERRRISQQDPPPPPKRRRSFLIVDCTAGKSFIHCDLLLTDNPTVREVRIAVAERLGRQASRIELRRCVSQRHGRPVYQVCDSNGHMWSWDFMDEDGRVWGIFNVNWPWWPTLHDNDLFFVAQGRKTYVDVHLRQG